MREILQKDYCY